jgi:hypothetical protein
MSLADLCAHAIKLQHHPDFASLAPHFALLNLARQPAQNVRSLIDSDSDKLFELLAGLLGMEVGKDILLDDPHQSKGTNPDILLTIGDVRWGIACKVPNRDNPLTLWDNFKKGLEQINNSDASRGFVFFNLKNLISLDEVWPLVDQEKSAWSTYRAPVGILRQKAKQLMDNLVNAVGKENYIDFVSNFDAIHVPIFLLYTGTGVLIDNRPVLTCLRQLATGESLRGRIKEFWHG